MQEDQVSGVRIPAHRRILIVEDDPDVRLLVTKTLKTRYTVAVATNGMAALQSALADPPDLFILDVMLPGMNGYELAERIRARGRLESIPIMFLTANYSADEAMRALALGVRHYMTKPFKVHDLRDRVERLVKEPVRRSGRLGKKAIGASRNQ